MTSSDQRLSNQTPSDQPPPNRVIKPDRKTPAARWNTTIMRDLSARLARDPEADITSLLPRVYARKLASLKCPEAAAPEPNSSFPARDVRSGLDATDTLVVLFKLSVEAENLLGNYECLSEAIVELLADAEVVSQSLAGASIFHISNSLAVKVTGRYQDLETEHRSLVFLEKHIPAFPAPRPHGLVRLGPLYLMFMTYIPGLNLEKAWPQLDGAQKESLSAQLNVMFRELRSLPVPDGTPLGGIQEKGCRDGRRMIHISDKPITNAEQFQDWIFAGARTTSRLYTEFIRNLTPVGNKIVFTHSDVRPANIMVERGSDGSWKVAAVIDWESSGFYPEYWESVKITNNMSMLTRFDWFKYLPSCISPSQYRVEWLADRLWDRHMENS